MVDRWANVIDNTIASCPDTRLITVLDAEYPANLRRVYDRPPFLFVRGSLLDGDARSVAVVGTRRASDEGRALTREVAAALTERGVRSYPDWPQASTPRCIRQYSTLAVGRSR